MRSYLFTFLYGFVVWLFAILFFVLFGDDVLYTPGTRAFFTSIILLIIGTGVLLWIVTIIYLQIDKSDNAALKLGLIGTIVGLLLDSVSLSFHQTVFPNLTESQVIAFTVWMAFAYALYLIIPLIINEKRKSR